MTSQADSSLRDDIIARNLAAVEVHFHNETPETIDKAISVYTDDIVRRCLAAAWSTATWRTSRPST